MRPKNVRLMFLLLKIFLIFGWNLNAQNRVVIDPGHGGKDWGAVGKENTIEKDIVLRVAKEIVSLNQTLLDNALDIYLTRYQDTLISLKDRARLAKALNGDIFFSLHCNHSDNPNANGIEVYVAKGNYQYSKASVWLAYEMQKLFQEKLRFKSRGIKFGNFQVLRESGGFYPSILIELGFMTHSDEADYFLKPNNIKAMALVVLIGLFNFLNVGL